MSYPSLCGFLSWAQYVCFVVCVGVRLLACECGAFSVLRHLSPFSSS
jgi:hypothetical protein